MRGKLLIIVVFILIFFFSCKSYKTIVLIQNETNRNLVLVEYHYLKNEKSQNSERLGKKSSDLLTGEKNSHSIGMLFGDKKDKINFSIIMPESITIKEGNDSIHFTNDDLNSIFFEIWETRKCEVPQLCTLTWIITDSIFKKEDDMTNIK